MNEPSASSWSGPEHYDPMASVADQDFGNLIDFDNLDLDFGDIDYSNGANTQDGSQQLSQLADSLDVQHLQHYTPPLQQNHHDATRGAPAQHQNAHLENHMSQPANNFFDFNVPAFSQPGQTQLQFSTAQEPAFHAHAGVPPTPNSVEMHGDATRYLQQMDPQMRALYEQRFHLRKEEAAFTPLVSPAVTPLENRYSVPDFTTVPGAYFSPLTSPALKAQGQHQQPSYHTSQYNTSGSSAGTSPVEMDVDMLGESAITQPEPSRKLRSTKRNAPRSSNASTRVKQSPIVKPNRRKATLSSTIPPKEVTDLLEEVQRSKSAQPTSNALQPPPSREGSEAESISPEPLTEMGPPPKPGSVTCSPAIAARRGQPSVALSPSSQGPCPATPASLMRIQQSPNLTTSPEVPPMLDDLTLPEAARPSLSQIDTAILEEDQSTPRLSARKTPKLGPLSTPSASAALSGKPSPMLSAVASPTSPAFSTNGARKSDAKGARNLKKRNSTSSALVSPALRPKISPSIKPLLPEGALADNAHALLLASKSNYQNILDGTTVPGVNYPTSLSTNLTSKRTSHKIAEQGRRNRINTALQEMQALLPSPNLPAKEAKSPDSGNNGSAAQQSNSKAAKVESAIEYIKQLQKHCSDQDKLLSEKDKEVEALRQELAALKNATATPDAGESEMKKETSSPEEVENVT